MRPANEHENKTVSVIVPVYKVESYLKQCVDSIVNQSYPYLEIILVDDGSPDRCPEICEEYAELDSRIKVIHKKNGGLSDARNAGLDAATGDYIGFVDSDDWIGPTMLEDLVEAAENYGADVACCGFQHIEDMTGASIYVKRFKNARQLSGPSVIREILSQDIDNVIVCNKLYRASMFHDVRFPFGQYDEDVPVLFQTVGYADKVVFIGSIGYFYRARTGSIMKSGSAKLHHESLLINLKVAETYVKEEHPEFWPDYRCYDALVCGFILKFYQESKNISARSEINALKRRLGSNLFIYLKSRVRIMCKIETLLVYLGIYKPVHDLWIAIRQKNRKKESERIGEVILNGNGGRNTDG